MSEDLARTATQRFVDIGRPQLAIRLVILLCPVVILLVTGIAGSVWAPVVLLIVPLAVGSAAMPDSHAGLLLLAVLLTQWGVAVDDPTTPWLLPVVLAAVVMHTAMAAATIVPPGSSWSAVTVRRWLRRTLVVLAVTLLTWFVAFGLAAIGPAGGVWLLVPALLLMVAAGAWIWTHSLGNLD
jgi:hypothetical protein